MMNRLDHIAGDGGNGHQSWVPYTVKASSSGCVTSASVIAQNQRFGASATRPPVRLISHHSIAASGSSTSSECDGPRCQVMLVTGSRPMNHIGSESRSGRVPSAAPAVRAARRCRAGAMAPASAAPRTIWVRESMAGC